MNYPIVSIRRRRKSFGISQMWGFEIFSSDWGANYLWINILSTWVDLSPEFPPVLVEPGHRLMACC
jgi:hypothetical protein